MNVFNELDYPYGFLANNAHTPFTLDGVKWNTATEYIYLNMFDKNTPWYDRMKKALYTVPFKTMIDLKSEQFNASIENTFVELLEKNKDSDFLKHLLRSKMPNTGMIRLDNVILKLQKPPFQIKDDLKNVMVSREEVIRTYRHLVKTAKSNVFNLDQLQDTLTYKDLVIMSAESGNLVDDENSNFPEGLFSNINHLVPFMKHKLGVDFYAIQVRAFKKHLGDLYMSQQQFDKDFSVLRAAKFQKISEFYNMEAYVDHAYLTDKLPSFFTNRILFQPDATIKSGTFNETNVVNDTLHLLDVFPMKPIQVNDDKFPTPFHYAYSKYFNETSLVQKMSLEALEKEYRQRILTKLIYLNTKALYAKFQHAYLAQLLLTTSGVELIYESYTDPILGVARGAKTGINLSGRVMMYLRDISEPRLGINYTVEKRSERNMVLCAFYSQRVKDMRTTCRLLTRPTVYDMMTVYQCAAIENHLPSAEESQWILRSAQLTREESMAIWPCIAYLKHQLEQLSVYDGMCALGRATDALNALISHTTLNNAREVLKAIYNTLKKKARVDSVSFTNAMLRDSLNRVNYWSLHKN